MRPEEGVGLGGHEPLVGNKALGHLDHLGAEVHVVVQAELCGGASSEVVVVGG